MLHRVYIGKSIHSVKWQIQEFWEPTKLFHLNSHVQQIFYQILATNPARCILAQYPSFAPKQGTVPIFAHTFLTFLGYYLLIPREVSLVCLSIGSAIVCLAGVNVSPMVR